MLIRRSTNLSAFRELIGPDATMSDAAYFLDALLVAGYENHDSRDIPEEDWLNVMNAALSSPDYPA